VFRDNIRLVNVAIKEQTLRHGELGQAIENVDQIVEDSAKRRAAAAEAAAAAQKAGVPAAATEAAGLIPGALTPEQQQLQEERARELAKIIETINTEIRDHEMTNAITAFEKQQEIDEARLHNAVALGASLKQLQDIQEANDIARNNRMKANFKSTWSFISSSALRENKKMFEIFKAADIAQAIADTYAAANVALRSAPPPLNYGLVAAVVAAGMANVAKIRSTQFGGGGGGGGMGGGGAGAGVVAPATGTGVVDIEDQIAQLQAQKTPTIKIDIIANGIVGNEEETSRRLTELIEEAIAGKDLDINVGVT